MLSSFNRRASDATESCYFCDIACSVKVILPVFHIVDVEKFASNNQESKQSPITEPVPSHRLHFIAFTPLPVGWLGVNRSCAFRNLYILHDGQSRHRNRDASIS